MTVGHMLGSVHHNSLNHNSQERAQSSHLSAEKTKVQEGRGVLCERIAVHADPAQACPLGTAQGLA